MVSSRASSDRWLNENVSRPDMQWWTVRPGTRHLLAREQDGLCAVHARSADVCLDNDGPFIDDSVSLWQMLAHAVHSIVYRRSIRTMLRVSAFTFGAPSAPMFLPRSLCSISTTA